MISGACSCWASRCFYVSPNVFDNVEVGGVVWPLENSELLLGKPLLYGVCCMYSRVVLLKDRFRGIHAKPFEGVQIIIVEDGEEEFRVRRPMDPA